MKRGLPSTGPPKVRYFPYTVDSPFATSTLSTLAFLCPMRHSPCALHLAYFFLASADEQSSPCSMAMLQQMSPRHLCQAHVMFRRFCKTVPLTYTSRRHICLPHD